jgi:hypothetical protein
MQFFHLVFHARYVIAVEIFLLFSFPLILRCFFVHCISVVNEHRNYFTEELLTLFIIATVRSPPWVPG